MRDKINQILIQYHRANGMSDAQAAKAAATKLDAAVAHVGSPRADDIGGWATACAKLYTWLYPAK